MKVAIYARVSTANNGQDPTMQTRELREYCERRGWQIAGEYVDHASGAKDSRPALTRLMADIHQRKCDTVLVWKLDRWGRSLRHLVNSIAEVEARGVAFVSLRDNLDLSTPAGRLMFQVIGAMAEFERALIQERVRAGMKNAKAKGRAIGRPRVKASAAQVARLRDGGASWRTIGGKLGVSARTARRLWGKSLLRARAGTVADSAAVGPVLSEAKGNDFAPGNDGTVSVAAD